MLERLLDALRADPATREEALQLHAASVEAGAAAAEARKASHPKHAACDRFRAGESVASIAESLGCSEQVVKAWIWRAGLHLPPAGVPFFLDQAAFHIAMIKAGYRYVSEVARVVGITPDYCGLIARGMVPSKETRAKIATALGVPESALWLPTSPHG
jgi:transcriptional regulator with XRE-family HTH domain